MEPTSPHLVPVPQPAMLELQAWEPSPLPWLAPLLPMLVPSPAAGVPSASKSQLIEWGKRCLEKKRRKGHFFSPLRYPFLLPYSIIQYPYSGDLLLPYLSYHHDLGKCTFFTHVIKLSNPGVHLFHSVCL